MKDRRGFLGAFGSAAIPVAVGAAATLCQAQTSTAPGIEGAWFIENTPGVVPGLPPEAQAPPFSELVVFGGGGVLIETNSLLHNNSYQPGNPSPINLNGSDGIGSWRRDAAGGIEAVFFKYLFDGNGGHVGFLKVSGVLTQTDPNRLGGDWTVEFQFFDPRLPRLGAPVRSVGTRIA